MELSLKCQGALVCLVPLTVLILELTWVQEDLSNPTNTLSNGPTTNLPSEEIAKQIHTGLSNRLTTIAHFDVGTPVSSPWRKRFKFEKSFETRRNTVDEGKRQKTDITSPTINHQQS